jgi:hypothetical protein
VNAPKGDFHWNKKKLDYTADLGEGTAAALVENAMKTRALRQW